VQITLKSKKINLGDLNYVEALSVERELREALSEVNDLLGEFTREARERFGISLRGGSFTTTGAPRGRKPAKTAAPAVTTRKARGPMSEEQKQRLRDAQNRRWAAKRLEASSTPAALTDDASTPRLVPPGTHA
jgi:transposase